MFSATDQLKHKLDKLMANPVSNLVLKKNQMIKLYLLLFVNSILGQTN